MKKRKKCKNKPDCCVMDRVLLMPTFDDENLSSKSMLYSLASSSFSSFLSSRAAAVVVVFVSSLRAGCGGVCLGCLMKLFDVSKNESMLLLLLLSLLLHHGCLS